MKKKQTFTLIEILVVATIIALLISGVSISYSMINKQSRDARRKADLEQIRSALEMYRSDNNYYPITSQINTTCGDISGLSSYLPDIPDDPKCPNYKYYYQALPSGCNNSPGNLCNDYTLAAKLESSSSSCSSPPPSNSCGSGNTCNYCLGPYGQK